MSIPNKWDKVDHFSFKLFAEEIGTTKLADKLKIDPSTIRAWKRNNRAPNLRFQVAIINMIEDFTLSSPYSIASYIKEFLKAHNLYEG